MKNNIDLIMKQNIRDLNPSHYNETPNTGKHLICNICDIQKKEILNDISKITDIIDIICHYNGYDAKQSMYNRMYENVDSILGMDENGLGCTLMYILTTGYHISIHTFPDDNAIAFDLYVSSGQYNSDADFILIYEFLVEVFEGGVFTSTYQIMERPL